MLFVTIRFPQKGDPRRYLGCKLKVVPKKIAVTAYFVVESPDLGSNQNLHRPLN
jgi:hypothetical protein